MEQLLKQLTEPGLPGKVDLMLRRRAAGVIVQLINRLRNEVPNADVIQYSTEDALNEYSRICNEEYYANFT